MAYSYIQYTGNGSQTNFTFPFGYLNLTDVVTSINGIQLLPYDVTKYLGVKTTAPTLDNSGGALVSGALYYSSTTASLWIYNVSTWLQKGSSYLYTYLSANVIQITPAPAVGTLVQVRRYTTKTNAIVDFTDGSVLQSSDLDLLSLFSLYTSQESDDAAVDSTANAVTAANAATTTSADLAVVEEIINNSFVATIASDLAGMGFAYDLGSVTEAASGVTNAPAGHIVTVSDNIASVNTVAANITSVNNAASNAASAAESASYANTAAINTSALLTTFRSVFLGAFINDTAATAYAAAQSITIADGIMYENTTADKFRIYSGTAWVDYDATAAASQSAAALSAASASGSASAASGSAIAAAGSQVASSASAGASAASAAASLVSQGIASAQAGIATTQAGTATGAANTATTQAGNAATSAVAATTNGAAQVTLATTQATNAANSAIAAANSVSVSLAKASNLSDLANAATARGNLGVPSGSGSSTGTNTGDQTLPTLSSLGAGLTAGQVHYGSFSQSPNLYFDGNNLGIGTSAPVTLKGAKTLQVFGNIKVGNGNGAGLISLGDIASSDANAGVWRGAAGAYGATGNYLNFGGYDGIAFSTGNADIALQTERMRIFASGGVSIGNTTDAGAGNLSVSGKLFGQASAGAILTLGVGTTSYATIDGGVAAFYPFADNTTSLGYSTRRWSVVYATTGTINTSDANDKQKIAALTASELSTANAIKGLIKSFQFNDSVKEKGDNARLHIGVIAQEVKAAFETNGLDPNKYGMFCSDTWYEVDGRATNEDGLHYTATSPDAIAITRLGIRYEELLAFVIATL